MTASLTNSDDDELYRSRSNTTVSEHVHSIEDHAWIYTCNVLAYCTCAMNTWTTQHYIHTHSHTYIHRYNESCCWLSLLVSNNPSTDLRVLNILSREHSWITWVVADIRWSSTGPSWSSNELPSWWASLCWVRHIEIGSSSPSCMDHHSYMVWLFWHYTVVQEHINILFDLFPQLFSGWTELSST